MSEKSIPLPLLDRALYWMAGKIMLIIGKRAVRRGDLATTHKMIAALKAGTLEREN